MVSRYLANVIISWMIWFDDTFFPIFGFCHVTVKTRGHEMNLISATLCDIEGERRFPRNLFTASLRGTPVCARYSHLVYENAWL